MSLGLFRCLTVHREKSEDDQLTSHLDFQHTVVPNGPMIGGSIVANGSIGPALNFSLREAVFHNAKPVSSAREHSTSSHRGKRSREFEFLSEFRLVCCCFSERRVLHDRVMYSSSRVEFAATLHHVRLNERMLVGGQFEEGSYSAGFPPHSLLSSSSSIAQCCCFCCCMPVSDQCSEAIPNGKNKSDLDPAFYKETQCLHTYERRRRVRMMEQD